MYEFLGGMGNNGKGEPLTRPTPPAPGPVARGEIDQFFAQTEAFEAQEQQENELRQQAASAERRGWIEQRRQQCEQSPELCAAATAPLCALLELPWGAAIGAIASPKGERWGGAKWGSLAAASTCLLRIPLARLGIFGGLISFGAAIAAPIAAAKWRLGWRP